MKLKLIRYDDNERRTFGVLQINGEFACHVLENPNQVIKVPGNTRIPKGIYRIGFNDGDTPLTIKYRGRYPWFTNHIEIKSVPNFTCIYLHVGNTAADTDGCLLVGETAMNSKDRIADSVNAFETVYKKISDVLKLGEYVTLEITEAI